jgi:hypothetical protein
MLPSCDLAGGVVSDSENTLNQSLASDVEDMPMVTPAPSAQEVGGPGEWQTQREALEAAIAELRQEVKSKDQRIAELSSSSGRLGETEKDGKIAFFFFFFFRRV